MYGGTHLPSQHMGGMKEGPPQLQNEVSSRPLWPTGEPVSEKKQGNSPHQRKHFAVLIQGLDRPPNRKVTFQMLQGNTNPPFLSSKLNH